jgi:hypothetical protein
MEHERASAAFALRASRQQRYHACFGHPPLDLFAGMFAGSRQATRKAGLQKSHPSEANNQLTPFVNHNRFLGVTFLFALLDLALLAASTSRWGVPRERNASKRAGAVSPDCTTLG